MSSMGSHVHHLHREQKDGQQYFIYLGQKETLGESCFAVDGGLSSRIRPVQYFIIVLHSLNERSV